MSAPYCYNHPRPAVTTDLIVFAWVDAALCTLLVRRKDEPFAGRWALPGGFLNMDEEAEAGARRELEEETGLVVPGAIDPLGFFARIGRDPRGRTITLPFAAILPAGEHPIRAGDDAAGAEWVPLDRATGLAFDQDPRRPRHPPAARRAADGLRPVPSGRPAAPRRPPLAPRGRELSGPVAVRLARPAGAR